MTDYNLGRATGEISIGYDSRGLRQAQADMAGTAAEAAALDAAMGRVNRSFDDNREKTHASAEEIVRARGEVDELRRAYKQYQDEYEQAQRVRQDAEERARDVIRDQSHDLDSLREARIALTRAQEEEHRLQLRAAEGLQAYHDKMSAVRLEVDKFNRAHVEATTGFRNMRREAEAMGEAVEHLTEKLAGVARVLGQAGLFGLFGGASAGSLFASGAGGLNLLAGAMAAVVQTAEAFAGAMALIPAGVNAAVLSLGSLAVSFHGVGAALSSLEDPTKFIEALRKVSPTMQQILLTVQSFTEAFRGARDAVQESFAQQIIQDIQPLITTWLPLLMNAGKQFATQWGQAFHEVFQIFNTPQAQAGFKEFVSNAVEGFRAARGAIQPLISAWNTLAGVGSQLFGRLGTAITNIATQFNNWIQRTAASGELFNFISKALDSFTAIGHTIRDVALSIHNIFSIFQGDGPGALQIIANLAERFRAWTESMKGQQSIANFFNLLEAAGKAITPVIKLLGEAISVIAGTLTRLGIAIGPGLTSFFNSFVEALRQLSPFVIQLAPALNAFLEALGQTLLQVIQTLGPKLPEFFNDMSQAFVQLLQLLPPMAELLGSVLEHLTPGRVTALLGLVAAFKLLGVTLAVLSANPITLIAGAIAGLVVGTILLITHWDTVKQKIGELTSSFGGMTGILDSVKRAWDSVTDAVGRWLDVLTGSIRNAWDSVGGALSDLNTNMKNFFADIAGHAFEWGINLVNSFVRGMRSVFGWVGDAAGDLISIIRDPMPSSRAKVGPFSKASPEELGAAMVTQYAGGMLSGRPAVEAASAGIAGTASGIGAGASGAGFGSQSFSSGGVAGKSGQDFSQGNTGFDQWVSFITKDLSAWNNIFQESFNLVGSIADIVTKTVRVAANLMNGGDNALTRPGGLLGPQLPIAQQVVPGVPSKQIPGVAPDKWGRDLAAKQGLPGQQGVPGVPTVNPRTGLPTDRPVAGPDGAPNIPGLGIATAGVSGTPPANPPASTTGQAPPATTGAAPAVQPGDLSRDASKQQIADYIINKALSEGYSREQANQILTQAVGESGLRADISGGVQGVDEVIGIFQEMRDFSGGLSVEDRKDPKKNIDAYFKQMAVHGGPKAFTDPAQFLGVKVSVGGPYHPENQAKGHLTRAQAAAAPYISGYSPPPAAPPPAAPPVSIQAPGNEGGRPGGVLGPDPGQRQPDIPAGGVAGAGAAALGIPIAYKIFRSNLRKYFQDRRDAKAAAGESTSTEEARLAMSDDDLAASVSPEERAAVIRGGAPSPADTSTTQPIAREDAAQRLGQINEAAKGRIAGLQARGVQVDSPLQGLTEGEMQEVARIVSQHPELGADTGAGTVNGRPLPPRTGPATAPSGPPSASRPLPPRTPAPAPAPASAPTPRPTTAQPRPAPAPAPRPTPAAAGADPVVGPKGIGFGGALGFGVNVLAMIPSTLDALDQIDLLEQYQKAVSEGKAPQITEDEVAELRLRPGLLTDSNVKRLGLPAYALATRPRTPADLGAVPNIPAGQVDPHTLAGVGQPAAPPPRTKPIPGLGIALSGAPSTPAAQTTSAAPQGYSPNPASRAALLGGASQTYSRQFAQSHGIQPLYTPGEYNYGDTRLPQWVRDMAQSFGLQVSSSVSESGADSLHGSGNAFDFTGSAADQDRFARYVRDNLASNTLQLIHVGAGGERYGIAGGQDVSGSRTYYDDKTYAGHGTGPGGHVHAAFDVAPLRGGVAPPAPTTTVGAGQAPPTKLQPGRPGQPGTPVDSSEMKMPPGWDLNQPIPLDVRRAHGIPDNLPPIYYPAEPGTVEAVPAPEGFKPGDFVDTPSGPTQVSPGGTISLPRSGTPGTPVPGFPSTNDQRTPLDKISEGFASAATIAGDGFKIFGDIIKDIGAAANMTNMLVRGFANTEDIVGFIRQIQPFLQTGADIAKLVGDIGGMAGAASGGADFGAGAGVQAIAGIVSAAFDAANQAITLGIDIYHEVGKYAGFIFGEFLGGANTGPLGGNVRMLLNTKTNQLQTYSENNPLNKNTFDVPLWQRSYAQQPNTQQTLPPQVNFYAGPGQSPQQFMSDSMFAVGVGSAAVASVAGAD